MKKLCSFILLIPIISCQEQEKISNKKIFDQTKDNTIDNIAKCRTEQMIFIKEHFGEEVLNLSPKEFFKTILKKDDKILQSMPNCHKIK